MPNLKEFGLICVCKAIKLEVYKQCIKKLISLDLIFIEFCACYKSGLIDRFNKYSLKEFKNIYPLLKLNNYKQIDIYEPYIIKNNN